MNAIKMDYCPPNSSMSVLWTNHGISECFMDTVSTSIISGFIVLFGSIQLYMYYKYATSVDNQVSRSKLYNFQIFLSLLVPVLAMIRFSLQVLYYRGGEEKIYGYMVKYIN